MKIREPNGIPDLSRFLGARKWGLHVFSYPNVVEKWIGFGTLGESGGSPLEKSIEICPVRLPSEEQKTTVPSILEKKSTPTLISHPPLGDK